MGYTNYSRSTNSTFPLKTTTCNSILQIGKLTDTDDYDICVNLVDNEETLDLNRKLRNKDKPADVLSIPLHPVTKHLNETIIILNFSI